MIISTPTKSGVPIDKEVIVGGGVTFAIPGTRYLTTVEVTGIDERAQTVEVKGFDGWLSKSAIIDVVDPSNFAVMAAMNRMDTLEDSTDAISIQDT